MSIAPVSDRTLPAPQAPELSRLWQWAEAGWLSRIDAAFAQWVLEQARLRSAQPHPSLPYIAALLSALQTRGHSCLPIDTLVDPTAPNERLAAMLGWPADGANHAAQAALQTLRQQLPHSYAQWLQALRLPLVHWHLHGPGQGNDRDGHGHDSGQPIDPAAQPGLSTHKHAAPLVLHVQAPRGHAAESIPQRLYLRRYHVCEQTVAHGLLSRTGSGASAPTPQQEYRIAHILDALFPPSVASATATNPASPPSPPSPTRTRAAKTPPVAAPHWQKIACALGLRQRLCVITGGPGTGKTYTAARLMAAALALAPQPARLRIQLAAPTGKAAARLSESLQQAIAELGSASLAEAASQAATQTVPQTVHQALLNIPHARTLHALLGARTGTRALQHHAGNPLALDWLFVDEASMVDLHMMAALLQALPPHAHLVLLGDKDQLDSVEAGSVLGDICLHAAQGQYSAETARYLGATCGATLHDSLLEPPISGGAPAIAQTIAMLRQSHRFGGSIGALAQAVQNDDEAAMGKLLQSLQNTPAHERTVFWKEAATLADARHLLWDAPPVAGYAPLATALQNAPDWPDTLAENANRDAHSNSSAQTAPEDQAWQARHAAWVHSVLDALARFRILCATRAGSWGVEGMNTLVLQALSRAGIDTRAQGWFAGRAVMVTRNDPYLGIFNGDVGIALPAAHDRNQLRVYFPQAHGSEHPHGLRSLAVSRMQHVETAFAMTVHKSQGSEFDHVLLCLSEHAGPLLTRELLYTGLTRARKQLSYLAPGTGLWHQAMARRTQRASGLAELLHGGGG